MEEGRESVLLRPGSRDEPSEDRNRVGGVRSQCGGTLLGEGGGVASNGRKPQSELGDSCEEKVTVTAEQILLYGKRQSRLIHLEANVIGYFGHIFRRR